LAVEDKLIPSSRAHNIFKKEGEHQTESQTEGSNQQVYLQNEVTVVGVSTALAADTGSQCMTPAEVTELI
jgi:hypothetical protein